MKPQQKEQKKPKGFKPGSSKGSFTQYLSDKIKQANEDFEGVAWLTYRGQRLKITTKPKHGQAGPMDQALIKSKGKIRLVDIVHKDGIKAIDEQGRVFHCGDLILAWVLESHTK